LRRKSFRGKKLEFYGMGYAAEVEVASTNPQERRRKKKSSGATLGGGFRWRVKCCGLETEATKILHITSSIRR
jgi:hypothetical protein